MTLQELINAVMLKATGKPTILASNNTKWEKIRGIANYYQHAWANEPGQHWGSLYDMMEVGTINTGSMYELPDTMAELSTAKGDKVVVIGLDGNRCEFELVSHDDLLSHPTGNYCAKMQNSLVFNTGFGEDDPLFGGTIWAPGYYKVNDLVEGTDAIVVDSPEWLVTMCAAEYIRNDIVKQNQYGNLVAEANNLMAAMIKNNRGAQVRHIRGSFRNGGGLSYD